MIFSLVFFGQKTSSWCENILIKFSVYWSTWSIIFWMFLSLFFWMIWFYSFDEWCLPYYDILCSDKIVLYFFQTIILICWNLLSFKNLVIIDHFSDHIYDRYKCLLCSNKTLDNKLFFKASFSYDLTIKTLFYDKIHTLW